MDFIKGFCLGLILLATSIAYTVRETTPKPKPTSGTVLVELVLRCKELADKVGTDFHIETDDNIVSRCELLVPAPEVSTPDSAWKKVYPIGEVNDVLETLQLLELKETLDEKD